MLRYLGPLLLGSILVTGGALACNMPPPTRFDTEAEYKRHPVVFLGTLVSTRQQKLRGENGQLTPRWILEDDVFRVVRAWKGVRPGQLVRFQQRIGPGSCEISAVSEPAIGTDPDKLYPRMKFSKTWLLYANGKEPHSSLQIQGASTPLQIDGVDNGGVLGAERNLRAEQRELDRLSKAGP